MYLESRATDSAPWRTIINSSKNVGDTLKRTTFLFPQGGVFRYQTPMELTIAIKTGAGGRGGKGPHSKKKRVPQVTDSPGIF